MPTAREANIVAVAVARAAEVLLAATAILTALASRRSPGSD